MRRISASGCRPFALYVAVIKGEVRARFKGRVYGSEWLKQIASQLRPIRTGSGSWNHIC